MKFSTPPILKQFPREFWTLAGATFIDRLGIAVMYPFVTLYVTQRFSVGLPEVGLLFGIFAVTSAFGSFLGGWLADRIGRKPSLILGLILSAASTLAFVLTADFQLLYVLAAIVGLLANLAEPAQLSMVADLLEEKQRAEGYSILKIASKLAFVFGPVAGSLLAANAFRLVFYADAVSSLLTAGIVYLAIPETRPKADSKKPRKGKADSGQSGYRHVFRDRRYLLFVFALFLVGLLHAQRESTLPVFLRDFYQTTPTQFGFLLSVNALLVLLLQLWVTRRLAAFPQFGVLAAGAVIFGAGFWAFGLAGMYWYFVLAIVIITLGEMMLMPASQALVSSFAPKALTGRYMALYGVSFAIPFALGPALAGLLSSRFGGLSIWRAAGVLGLIAAISFMMLAVWPAPARKKPSKRGKP